MGDKRNADKASTRVAVVTRWPDRSGLLSRTVASVATQTLPDYIHLIAGRCTREALGEALSGAGVHGDKVRLASLEDANGPGSWLNQSLKLVESEFVAIHDGGGSWHPDFLQAAVAHLEQTGRNAVLTGVTTIVERSLGSDIVVTDRIPCEGSPPALFDVAAMRQLVPPIAVVYRRAVHDEIGWYREDASPLEFWEFVVRFLERWDMGFLPRHLAYVHQLDDDSEPAPLEALSALRNKLLREDLASGRFGRGTLLNLALSEEARFHDQSRAVDDAMRNWTPSGPAEPTRGVAYRLMRRAYRSVPDGWLKRMLSGTAHQIAGGPTKK